jgi:hypothetical protein
MTVKIITFCDTCGKECEKSDYISVIIGDGHYCHIHTDCLSTNVSNWLTKQSDPDLRRQFVNVLLGKGAWEGCGRLSVVHVEPDPI